MNESSFNPAKPNWQANNNQNWQANNNQNLQAVNNQNLQMQNQQLFQQLQVARETIETLKYNISKIQLINNENERNFTESINYRNQLISTISTAYRASERKNNENSMKIEYYQHVFHKQALTLHGEREKNKQLTAETEFFREKYLNSNLISSTSVPLSNENHTKLPPSFENAMDPENLFNLNSPQLVPSPLLSPLNNHVIIDQTNADIQNSNLTKKIDHSLNNSFNNLQLNTAPDPFDDSFDKILKKNDYKNLFGSSLNNSTNNLGLPFDNPDKK